MGVGSSSGVGALSLAPVGVEMARRGGCEVESTVTPVAAELWPVVAGVP